MQVNLENAFIVDMCKVISRTLRGGRLRQAAIPFQLAVVHALAEHMKWRASERGERRMVEIGYSLSCEEHPPNDLVRYAQRAEEKGFTFALISDHYHPWVERQGQSPFVWSVIGGIAQTT